MKKIRLLLIGLLLLTSGCFPVFVPVDGGRGGHGDHDRGGGDRGHGEHR